jgi:putative DNA primase/helicase
LIWAPKHPCVTYPQRIYAPRPVAAKRLRRIYLQRIKHRGESVRQTSVRRDFRPSIKSSYFQQFNGKYVFRRPPRSAIIRLQKWDIKWDQKVRRTDGKGSEQTHDEIDIEIEDEAEASAGKKSKWPPGFKMTPAGLKWTDPEKQSHVFVCGPIEVLAATCDPKNCGWGVLVRWKDPKGHAHEWAVPKSILGGDGAELRRVLLDEGLNLGASLKSRNLLVQFLISVRADGFVRAVQSTGWHGNRFVFPDGTIGDATGEHTILQTEKYLDHDFNVRGTLEDWQQNVAKYATGNSRLVLAVSIAFAAALIGPCGIESGGVHFVGPSSTGKTTTLVAAGSVWGGGDAGYVQTWRTTSNGLEATAAAHNDALLCLDELAQVSSQEAGATAYMLANEKGKSRSTRELRVRKAVEWRLLYLSSGEMSLADKIGEDGRGRKETAGQRVRVVEVPADTGVHGLFENLHDFPDAAQFAKQLAGAAKAYYGTPARAFIASVSGDLGKTKGLIRQGVQAFIDGRKLDGASGQVKRVCERFGIAAAAGELAIALGIVPWPKGEAVKAAAVCFRAWIDARGGLDAAEVTNGIAAVRAFLSAHGSSRFEAAWEEPPRDRDGNPVPLRIVNQAGWRKRVILEDGEEAWDYLISADAWREAAAGFNAGSLARTLLERGYLLPGGDGKSSRNKKIPGHGQRRVYHISHTLLGGGADG